MSQESGESRYEDKNPLVVEDDKFSNKRSFIDREILSELIESLAYKIFNALLKDKETNEGREAIRMVLSNRLKHDPNSSIGQRKKKKEREEFELILPLCKTSWNDMDQCDIEIQLIKCVVDIHDQYKWYKVKIRATHFISREARERLDAMEAEDDSEALHENKPTISKPRVPPSSTTPKPQSSERQLVVPPPPAVHNNNNQSEKNLNPKTCSSMVDDDDDIEILCEIPKK